MASDIFNHMFFCPEEAESKIMWFERYFMAMKGGILKGAVFMTIFGQAVSSSQLQWVLEKSRDW